MTNMHAHSVVVVMQVETQVKSRKHLYENGRRSETSYDVRGILNLLGFKENTHCVVDRRSDGEEIDIFMGYRSHSD